MRPISWRAVSFFSSRRRHTRFDCDWSSDVCSSDLSVDKVPVFSMGYGMTAAADGRWFPWVFSFPTTYWSQASAVIRYMAQQEGGMDKLRGKKIVHIFHNSPYGKEANPTLETLARQMGFELTLLAVDHPGQEQRATWLH